ncbi:MAG: respiratory nitrate reductase subunit gamma [Planctomycetes bacterium]|nr:respiratory nitrate reductase subunit gamma [Planctomycetota bacterium]
MTWFFWGVYPYLCIALFFLVPLIRLVYSPFSWSTRASGFFGNKLLGVASLCLHWGLILLLVGHVAGLIGGLLGLESWIRFFYWIGLAGGMLVLAGSSVALVRRMTVPQVRAMSQADDYVVHLFLIPIVALALYQVLVHRIFGVAFTASAWFGSLWRFSPQPELMDGASLISRIHIFLALTFFAYFPFTKLVHFWTYPIRYAARAFQTLRTERFRFLPGREFLWRGDGSWLVYGLGSVAVLFAAAGFLLGSARRSTPAKADEPARDETGARRVLTGYPLYVSQCARCHGMDGRGKGLGADSPTFSTKPRDLAAARYRFVSTGNGVASDEDLARTIRHGLEGSGMPAFPNLADEQVGSLVAHLNALAAEPRRPGESIAVGERPKPTGDSVKRGKELFAQNCVMCHGNEADGKGVEYQKFTDPQGLTVLPANLRDGALKTGRDPRQLFLRVSAGIPGGKDGAYFMPPFQWMPETDRWSIVEYLLDLNAGRSR